MPAPAPELDRIRRPFDTAFQRICEATAPDAAEDEFSNLLGQLYRLSELGKNRLGDDVFHKRLLGSDDLRGARAAVWARTFDVHDVVAVASMGAVLPDYFTAMLGVLVWKPLASLPKQSDKFGRHQDYANFLENRSVLGTTPPRFRRPGRPPIEGHGTRTNTRSLSKSSRVVVVGRLQQRIWTAEDGSAPVGG